MTTLSESTRSANWTFLWRKLEASQRHQTVSAVFAKADDRQLAVLLRHHLPDGVPDPVEVAFRATVDAWLGQVEMLYVAWLCGYVPDPSKQDQAVTLRRILGREALRVYYERHYPIALPWLFRLHLEGSVRIDPVEQLEAAGAFERFAVVYERFRGDENLLQFLNYLDGFAYGAPEARIDIRTVVAAFESPRRVTDALRRPAGSLDSVDRGIVGLVRFLTFCEDLDSLLQLCRTMPLVQSTFWFFYVYWFTEFGKDLSKESAKAVDNIAAASAGADPSSQAFHRATAEEHGAELKLILQRLTNSHYARPLYDEVRERVSHAVHPDASAREWLERFRPATSPLNASDRSQREPEVASGTKAKTMRPKPDASPRGRRSPQGSKPRAKR